MDDGTLPQPSDGMGPTPHGPGFVPAGSPRQQPGPDWPGVPNARTTAPRGTGPIGPTRISPTPPPRRRTARIATAVVVAIVVAVVVAASAVARYADTHIPSPGRPTASPPPVDRGDRIDFTTRRGSGQLILISREWIDGDREEPPAINGSYLRVEVQLVCFTGEVDYDPYNFQVFDRNGTLFDLAVEAAGDPLLDVGTLDEGESVRGTVGFDMPRGEATLLMSDDAQRTVTALRIPG